MSALDQKGFTIPDLSGFAESMKRIHEIGEACTASMQQLHEISQACAETMRKTLSSLQPMLDYARNLRDTFLTFAPKIAEASRAITVSCKLGEVQYVQWDYLEPAFFEMILSSQNTNKTLREQIIVHGKQASVNTTIEKTRLNPIMKRHLRIYNQAIDAFHNGDSDLAVIGFTTVFDGLLSDVSGINTSKIKKRLDVVMDKMEKCLQLDPKEYALATFLFTFENSISLFTKTVDFKEKEPKGLNRHWIAHGQSRRKKTKLDCVKIINMIYGLLLIEELERKDLLFDESV
ncbi:MAG: hypothetical protein IJQ45_08995 [Clostridia bacterium]|nr:hypothetical protein [Clostridia bacterium]